MNTNDLLRLVLFALFVLVTWIEAMPAADVAQHARGGRHVRRGHHFRRVLRGLRQPRARRLGTELLPPTPNFRGGKSADDQLQADQQDQLPVYGQVQGRDRPEVQALPGYESEVRRDGGEEVEVGRGGGEEVGDADLLGVNGVENDLDGVPSEQDGQAGDEEKGVEGEIVEISVDEQDAYNPQGDSSDANGSKSNENIADNGEDLNGSEVNDASDTLDNNDDEASEGNDAQDETAGNNDEASDGDASNNEESGDAISTDDKSSMDESDSAGTDEEDDAAPKTSDTEDNETASADDNANKEGDERNEINDDSNTSDDDNGNSGGEPVNGLDMLRQTIPGEPGVDYPILGQVPETGFECTEDGYFGDKETMCQVYYVCFTVRQRMVKHGFLCPNGTLFSDRNSVCEWWFNVDCNASSDKGRNVDGNDEEGNNEGNDTEDKNEDSEEENNNEDNNDDNNGDSNEDNDDNDNTEDEASDSDLPQPLINDSKDSNNDEDSNEAVIDLYKAPVVEAARDAPQAEEEPQKDKDNNRKETNDNEDNGEEISDESATQDESAKDIIEAPTDGYLGPLAATDNNGLFDESSNEIASKSNEQEPIADNYLGPIEANSEFEESNASHEVTNDDNVAVSASEITNTYLGPIQKEESPINGYLGPNITPHNDNSGRNSDELPQYNGPYKDSQ